MWNKTYAYYKTKKQGGYDSKFEAGYGQELEIRKKAKDIKNFEAHVRLPLVVNNYTVCDYYIDFKIYHNDGTIEFCETKGFPTPAWKIKWKLFCALYEDDPNTKITLIMQGKNYNPRLRKAR
jgi:hypothetical protein